jgi:steroid delta-isomerase-like uncharacterized protein
MPTAREVVAAATEAFNAHDEERIRAVYAEDVVLEAPGEVRREGVDAAVEYYMGWLRAFPDAEIRVLGEVAEDDWVAHRFTFEGTHQDTLVGPTGEIPATNRQLTGQGMEFFRVKDGRIVEDHLCFDQVQLMTQLGLLRELATSWRP